MKLLPGGLLLPPRGKAPANGYKGDPRGTYAHIFPRSSAPRALMASESIALPTIQASTDADPACGQAAGWIEGNAAHGDFTHISSPLPPLTYPLILSDAALSVRHEVHPLQCQRSPASFVTCSTKVDHNGFSNPGAEPLTNQPDSMEEYGVAESSNISVSEEVTVFLGTAPVSMWMTARYQQHLLCVESSPNLINRAPKHTTVTRFLRGTKLSTR